MLACSFFSIHLCSSSSTIIQPVVQSEFERQTEVKDIQKIFYFYLLHSQWLSHQYHILTSYLIRLHMCNLQLIEKEVRRLIPY